MRVLSVNDVVVNRIRTMRRRKGLSAEGLAERCQSLGALGLSVHVLRHVEAGRKALTVGQLAVIAVALDMPPIELLNASDENAACVEIAPKVRVDCDLLIQWIKGHEVLVLSNVGRTEKRDVIESRSPVDESWAKDVDERIREVFGVSDRNFEADFGRLVRVLRETAESSGSVESVLKVLERFETRLGFRGKSGESN